MTEQPKKLEPSWDRLTSYAGLLKATRYAVKGKRRKGAASRFLQSMEWELLALAGELKEQIYRPLPYRELQITDPKPRVVSAAAFRDRVVHHALYAEIEPLFEKAFVFDSYANRKGKGTHAALRRYRGFAQKFDFTLRCDVYRYFPAIDHAILKADLRKRVHCNRLWWLIELIIDHSNKQEPVDLHFDGDDLLTPVERRRGLPIGNLTSQFFGNVYLNPVDHFIKEVLRIKGYVRYVDDFALFSHSHKELVDVKRALIEFLARRRLKLHPQKSAIFQTNMPNQFLGFELPNCVRRCKISPR